jgi:hypothetical protein
MRRYRVIQDGEDSFRIQYMGRFFWTNFVRYTSPYPISSPVRFKTLEEAENSIREFHVEKTKNAVYPIIAREMCLE